MSLSKSLIHEKPRRSNGKLHIEKMIGNHLFAPIPILSFFAGGGFLDMGFEQAGFETIWSNEANPLYAEGYEYGVTTWRVDRGNNKPARVTCVERLENLKAVDIAKSAFSQGYPNLWGIVGGPPCPDFSNGGKNKGRDGLNGRLSQVFVDQITSLCPDFFVFENVPGLLRIKRHREFFGDLVRQLRTSSPQYVCDWKVLNALDYGVPQDRKRVFLVGVSKRLFALSTEREAKTDEINWFPWPKAKFLDALNKYDWPSVNNELSSPKRPENIPLELMTGHYLNGKNPPQNHPNGSEAFEPYSSKFQEVKEGDINHKSFKRLHRWRYSPTAAYGNNEVHLHPWEPRRLTVREALRLQSIPDSYVLPSGLSLTAKFKLITNGVPMRLAHAVAESLRKFILQCV